MKTEQVFEGFGKAVAATQPAQEYCFFWVQHWSMCMTKAEWSGWMQAIGTFAAILFAITLPFLQNKLQRARSFVMARHSLAQLVGTYEAIQIAMRQGKNVREAIVASNANLESLFKAFDAVHVAELPVSSLPSWWSARANAMQLKALQGFEGSDSGFAIIVEKYKFSAVACLADFGTKEPDIFGIRARSIWG